jgi:hypothetical protein
MKLSYTGIAISVPELSFKRYSTWWRARYCYLTEETLSPAPWRKTCTRHLSCKFKSILTVGYRVRVEDVSRVRGQG